jgi:pyrophosphate--fructose-6-phosphate 1-phosphotransferase
MASLSLLQQYRLKYKPKLPDILKDLTSLIPRKEEKERNQNQDPAVLNVFQYTYHQPFLSFEKKQQRQSFHPLKVGVVLSGGQAPGGHNVISGLFDALKKFNSESRLIGFCDGPSGIIKNKTIEITEQLLSHYRNQGGFDIIGSGRTKIETPDQFSAAEATMKVLDLDGLVIIGGDDSNTNAAFLAEYFENRGIKTRVIGVPKTIDGDLKNEWIEISFGFDTASKIYSEIIGNILKDNLSSKKYYYFIKLMGRSASHVTLECALQTHVNMTLIGEEIAERRQTLSQLIKEIGDVICMRAEQGKNYGTVLISEGVIEFIPEFKQMIQELNHLLATDQPHFSQMENLPEAKDRINYIAQVLNQEAKSCFLALPMEIQNQLILDRDPHGNVQVSKIETERLLIALVEKELKKRQREGTYKGKFASQPLFCGYEGRSGLPSNFDCQYCYALGHVAALLIHTGVTGYMCCVQNLIEPVEKWRILGVPIANMIHMEMREGKKKAVIQKALVNLKGRPFLEFKSKRDEWTLNDDYCCPGPIQFEGPSNIIEASSLTLIYEQSSPSTLEANVR